MCRDRLKDILIVNRWIDREIKILPQINEFYIIVNNSDIYLKKDTDTSKTPLHHQDRLLAELLKKQKKWIVQYHEHDSLLENRPEEELTEEERKAAWEEFEQDKLGIRVNNYPNANAGG